MRRYTDLFRTPGALGFSLTGLIARMPMAMRSLAIIILIEKLTDSYAVAGAIAGTYGLVSSVASPFLARLMDRYGQARLLRPAVAVDAGAFSALIALAVLRAPTWSLFAAAAVSASAYVPIGSAVRARWSHALAGRPQLPTAYALESVLDEVVFILGPVLVTVVATSVHPAGGAVLAVVLVTVGSYLLAAQHGSEPPPRPAHGDGSFRGRPLRGLIAAALALAGTGAVFGAAEVTVVAFTEQRGIPWLAGAYLALWALCSMIAGLTYGAVSWRAPVHRQFLVAVTVFGLSAPLFLLADSLWTLAAVMAVTGFTIAPALITGFSVVAKVVPAGRLTEALTWATTGTHLLLAFAIALAGWLIEQYGTEAGFLVAVVGGLSTAILGWAALPWLRPDGDAEDETPDRHLLHHH